MWLTIEIVAALYLVSFAWFWSLCRLSVPTDKTATRVGNQDNLIPFERGNDLRARKKTGT